MRYKLIPTYYYCDQDLPREELLTVQIERQTLQLTVNNDTLTRHDPGLRDRLLRCGGPYQVYKDFQMTDQFPQGCKEYQMSPISLSVNRLISTLHSSGCPVRKQNQTLATSKNLPHKKFIKENK